MKPCYYLFHRWGKWEPYQRAIQRRVPNSSVEGVFFSVHYKEDSPWFDDVENRQKRRCERCGLTQDEEIEL